MSTSARPWALLSRHGHALIHLAKNPRMRLVDLARDMDLTERSVRLLIGSLGRTEFLKIVKAGRNNSYQLDLDRPLPHPFEKEISLNKVIQLALEIAKK
jgi:predicted DNA-binding transcriptional regulator